MSKLELIELRKTGNIEKTISLVDFYIGKEKKEKDKNYTLAQDLLIEYLLHGKYNLIQELIKIYDKSINNPTLQKLLELVDVKINNVSSKKYEERLNYFTNAEYSYNANSSYYKLVNFLISSSKVVVIPALKIKILEKACEYDYQIPEYVLGMYYKKIGKTEESIEWLKKSAEHHYRPAALELVDYYKDDSYKKNYYMTKAVLKTDKDEIFNLVNMLKQDSKTVRVAYNYLLDNIYSYKELTYELATWFEKGLYIKENKLYAYTLYLCCDGYKDSNEKANLLNKILKEEYKKKNDLALDEDLAIEEQERIKKEKRERKAKEKQDLFDKEFAKFQFELCDSSDGGIRRGEKKREYNYKVKVFEKACCSNNINSVLEYLNEASNLGHIEAKIALFNYYKEDENSLDTAIEYLMEAAKKNDRAKKMLKEFNQSIREANKNQKQQDQEYVQNLFNEAKTDSKSLKELFYKANSDYDTEKFIKRVMGGKKLPKHVLNIISEVGEEGYLHSNLFLFDYYKDVEYDSAYKIRYALRAHKSHDTYAIMKLFKECFITDIKNTHHYFSKDIIHYVVNLKSKEPDIIYFQAVILGDRLFGELYDVEINEKLSLEKLLYIYDERGFCYTKENVALMISSYYEKGIGTKRDLSEAIVWSEKVNKDSTRSIMLRKKYEENKNRATRIPKNQKLIKEYSNTVFEQFLQDNPDFKQQIEERYLELDTEDLRKELICRNELLDKNYKVTSLYKKNGFSGFSIKVGAQIMEEEAKERQERERQIKLEEEKKAKIEAERKEKERKIKLEQERVRKLEEFKKEQEKQAQLSVKTPVQSPAKTVCSTSSDTSSSSVNKNDTPVKFKQITGPMPEDSPYFKSLKANISNTTILVETKAVARIRQKYDYPLEPSWPTTDENGKKLSKHAAEKLYMNQLEERKDKLTEYYKRLYSQENQIKINVRAYRKKVWNHTETITVTEFIKKCEEIYNSKIHSLYKISLSAGSYTYKNSGNYKISGNTAVERMLAFVPNYAEITITIKGDLYYERDNQSSYHEHWESFENSDLKKLGTWQEYSDSSKSEIGAGIYLDLLADGRRDGNQRLIAARQKEQEIKKFMLEMFNKHIIFAGFTYIFDGNRQYVEGEVNKIKYEFKWNYK